MVHISELELKKNQLFSVLKRFDSLAIAFSGGADSALLLAAACEVLKKNTIAVTLKSKIHPVRETKSAIDFTQRIGVRHIIVDSKIMNQTEFIANHRDRCYICKKIFFKEIADAAGTTHIAHGAVIDDLNDFRPGLKAANEMNIIAPLIEAGITKNDVRGISKLMGLITWNKPPMSCLATRIPYGTIITDNILKMIETSEDFIIDSGFKTCRVRYYGDTARIEADPEDISKLMSWEIRQSICDRLKKIGFYRITADMEGYIPGRGNAENSDPFSFNH